MRECCSVILLDYRDAKKYLPIILDMIDVQMEFFLYLTVAYLDDATLNIRARNAFNKYLGQ